MALHRGPADLSPTGDYFAPGLYRLARLLATGHGGQVLLSATSREAVGSQLPEGVTVVSLGQHRLRDLLEAEEIWQLVIPGLPSTFPPLKSLEGHPTNLPQQTSDLLGREESVATLRELLAQGTTRLITLTGSGGVGKTRLALAVAAEALETFPDGVFLVTLASVEDATLFLPEIAAVLGVREGGGLSLEESVLAYLGGKHLLLVLDNFEQLRPFENASGVVADLLERAPEMRVLATSRAPLRIRGEQEWPVPPLATPAPIRGAIGAEELVALAANPAVELFVGRARAARTAWRLTVDNAADVAEIARRLEGLPLALELAAARIRVLSPADILRRLASAFDLLEAQTGDRPDRQQTLRAAIAWSYDLLRFEDQAACRRLGVFAGGFTLEAAEAVLGDAPDPWVDALDAVAVLAEQSLLRVEELAESETRYRMLETVRTYSLEELAAAGEEDHLRSLQARWAERFAREADTHVLSADSADWLERYEREHDNFRAALSWAITNDPNELGLRTVEAMWRFWQLRGHYAEGRSWLERALEAGQAGREHLRALVLDGLGNMAWRQGDLDAAAAALTESLEIWRALGDRRNTGGALSNLGTVTELQGDYERALALQEEALAIAREVGEPLRVATALNNLALLVWNSGEIDRAIALLEESIAIKREKGNRVGLVSSLNNLGMLMVEKGDLARALAYLDETLAIDRDLGSPDGIADSLGNIASLTSAQGDYSRAAGLELEALELRRELGDKISIAYSIHGIAATAARAGFAETSVRLFGAEEQLRTEVGAPVPPSEQERYEEGVARARSVLAEHAFAQAWAEGRALSLDDAIAEARRAARQLADLASVPA
jgi:predicted ATPase